MMYCNRPGFAEARHWPREIEAAPGGFDRAAEPPIWSVMILDRAAMAPGTHKHRPVILVDIIEHDADRGEVVIGPCNRLRRTK
jgi:hypothetical protein